MKLLRHFPPFIANILTILIVSWSFHMPWTHVVVIVDDGPFELKFPFEVGLFRCYSDVCTDFIDILAPNSTISRVIKSPSASLVGPPPYSYTDGDFMDQVADDGNDMTNAIPVQVLTNANEIGASDARVLYYRPKLPLFEPPNADHLESSLMNMKRTIVAKFERPFVIATMRSVPFIFAGMALCLTSVVWSLYVYFFRSTARVQGGDIVRTCRMPKQVRMLYAAMILLSVGGLVYVLSTAAYIIGGWYCYGFVFFCFNIVVGCLCGLIAIAAKEKPYHQYHASYALIPESTTAGILSDESFDSSSAASSDQNNLIRTCFPIGPDSVDPREGVYGSYQQMLVEMVEMHHP